MKRANIGCLDNRDRISDGKTFVKKRERRKGEETSIHIPHSAVSDFFRSWSYQLVMFGEFR